MTLERLAGKITSKNAHLITLSDEKSGTMLFKALRTGFVENKGQSALNQVLCQLAVKPKANVISQLNFRLFVSCQLKFWPFVSCQLTPSRPSFVAGFSFVQRIMGLLNCQMDLMVLWRRY